MKKIVCLLLVLLILAIIPISCTASEEFSMHSGVKFGMTMDEVIEAEKANGFSCNKRSLNYAYFSDSGDYIVATACFGTLDRRSWESRPLKMGI